MNHYQQLVRMFHDSTDSTVGGTPEMRDNWLRAKLILEEAVETVAAMGFDVQADIYNVGGDDTEYYSGFQKEYDVPNFAEAIDGLCDLLYVTFGTAVAWGIDLDPFFEEVHRANMAKLKGPKREDGKQLKPEGWQPPDIEGVLEAATNGR